MTTLPHLRYFFSCKLANVRQHNVFLLKLLFKGELNEHRVNIHFPEDKICPFCDKPFETRFNSVCYQVQTPECFVARFYRDSHIRRVHEVSPPRSLAFPPEYFECDQCSYKSKKKLFLISHVRQKHGSKAEKGGSEANIEGEAKGEENIEEEMEENYDGEGEENSDGEGEENSDGEGEENIDMEIVENIDVDL